MVCRDLTDVFTNGTDTIPPSSTPWDVTTCSTTCSTARCSASRNRPRGIRRSEAAIEAHLGERVERHLVWFTDDRLANVEPAREFGWDAVLFILPDQDVQTGV